MIVEFDTVRCCAKELYDREIAKEVSGEASVPFYREHDYKTKMTVELDRIVDFTAGRVFMNDQCFECVYAYDSENEMSPNLLISYEDFKKMYETYKSIKILRHEQI